MPANLVLVLLTLITLPPHPFLLSPFYSPPPFLFLFFLFRYTFKASLEFITNLRLTLMILLPQFSGRCHYAQLISNVSELCVLWTFAFPVLNRNHQVVRKPKTLTQIHKSDKKHLNRDREESEPVVKGVDYLRSTVSLGQDQLHLTVYSMSCIMSCVF